MRSIALLLALMAACSSTPGSVHRTTGVVSAATPEAAAAGAEILALGGNAFDAAVAVQFALAVTEPAGSGLFGQSIIIAHPPGAEPFVVLGTSWSPKGVPSEFVPTDVAGHRATTVPSTVRVLHHSWKKHGSGKMEWTRLLEPAIRIAETGYILGHFRHRTLQKYASRIQHEPTKALLLRPDGSIPAIGERIRMPLLAKTLRRLADAGADDFYKGKIAREIARDMKENGGWITLDDLEQFPEPRTVAPLHGTYRGWDVYTLPPPAGGWVVLQALNLLEHAPEEELTGRDWRRRVWLAEALRVAHTNREQRPVTNLKEFEEEIRIKVGKSRANDLFREMDPPGSGETTHFSIVDADGLALGVTSSINAYYGAKVSHPTLGLIYNDYMREFELENETHPFYLRPGAMPYSSMSGTILARAGKPHLVAGSPGSKRIISAVVQVISRWVDVERDIRKAVHAPRLHVVPERDLLLEPVRLPPGELLELEKRGFDIARPLSSLYKGALDPYFGGVHAVALDPNGWKGAADPRRDGAADPR